MKVVDKKWSFGSYKVFVDVPSDLMNFKPGCRVVPAPFLGRPGEFHLIAKYEPGENKHFPNGGFEVRGQGSMRHSFELDQVVIWTDGNRKTKKATARRKTGPLPKPAATSTASGICGAAKKDGTTCKVRTTGDRCRHHKL
jgi:hypothetical protein